MQQKILTLKGGADRLSRNVSNCHYTLLLTCIRQKYIYLISCVRLISQLSVFFRPLLFRTYNEILPVYIDVKRCLCLAHSSY